MEKGYEHVFDLLQKKERPTAIFFTNDLNAHLGYKAVHDAGLNIPDDVSMIGFDDIDLSHMSSPQLTTIRAYKEELGSIAIRKLLKSIQNPEHNSSTTVVPVKLIERESVKKLN